VPEVAALRLEKDRRESVQLIIVSFHENIIYKIPPHLPFPKGGIEPLFGKEGHGEIF
jgi:hypothetical protein